MSNPFARVGQCKACPWKKSTNPHTDITGGYDAQKHTALASCRSDGLHAGSTMACHESLQGKEYACVGWIKNQLESGNNLALRMAAITGRLNARALRTEGEQHETLEAMAAAGVDDAALAAALVRLRGTP